jgi:molecular chaperone HtpG
MEKSLQLYSSKVFIQDDCKELLPDYLRFVKGIVDTEDLPLNVSREVTQNSPVMTKIKNVLTGKILDLLQEWSEKDQDKFDKFYTQFSSMLKTGVNSDYTNKDKIIELLRFETSSLEKGKKKSFKEYVATMQPDQKEIYYILGDSREGFDRNPNLEYFKKKGIEVIYLTDPVDMFTITYIFTYDSKPIKSIEKADIDFSNEVINKDDRLNEEQSTSLLDKFKQVLGDKVEDVVESKRLVDSAVTIVVGKEGMDSQMEKVMQILDKEFTVGKRILEINTGHKLIKNLADINKDNPDSELLTKAINQVYEGALLMEGYLKSPVEFISRMTEILEKATENK